MGVCTACGYSQEGGEYCSQCSVRFENNQRQKEQRELAATQETPKLEEKEFQLMESIEKVKEQSKGYFTYLIGQLKVPSAKVDEVSSLKNAIISIGLLILLTVTGVYGVQYGFVGEFSAYAPSFGQVLFYLGFFFLFIFGINFLAIFVTVKLFSKGQRVKHIICQIGNYYAVPLIIVVIAVLFSMIQSTMIALLLLFTGITIAFGIVPLVVVHKVVNQNRKGINRLLTFLLYFLLLLILTVLLIAFISTLLIGGRTKDFL